MLSKEHRRIYLVAQNPGQMESLKTVLGTFENSLQVAGVFEEAEKVTVEDITNDINTVTPYVVFAVYPANDGIDFITSGKKYMNTRLIVVMQPEMLNVKEDGSVKNGLMTKLSGRLFTRIAGKYKQ